MSSNNTVAIVSNAEYTTNTIKEMLVLLRDIDKVECYDYYDADEFIKKTRPNAVILHSGENDKNCIKLIKKIRRNDDTSSIPIILYPEYPNADFIVEAFDAGITDILSTPIQDYELIIRVIWAIQKSELETINKSKDNFLAKLGIIDEETGFYKEAFSLKYLESVISQAKNSRHRACLMMIRTKYSFSSEADKASLTEALASSVRLNDTIAIKDENTYYIFLSKAKLNGVYSIYERLLSRTSPMTAIAASVVEIKDELFDDIITVLDNKIEKSPKNGELAVVQKEDFMELYAKEEETKIEEPALEISKILKNKEREDITEIINKSPEDEVSNKPIVEPEIAEELKEVEDKEAIIEIPENEEDKIDLGIKIMQEKVKKLEEDDENHEKKSLKSKKEIELQKIDERNAILYKQSYIKKLDMVADPLLKRYAGKLQAEFKTMDADIKVSADETYMKLDKDDIKLNLQMSYDGLKSVVFNLSIVALGSEIESDTFTIEVMEFDSNKLDIILNTIFGEYRNYLTAD